MILKPKSDQFELLVRTTYINMSPFEPEYTLLHQLDRHVGPPGVGVILCVVSVLLVLLYLDTTDVLYIRGLSSAPGVPIFGNLIQLGVEHPKRLAELAKKYGPVYQIRLGNRVSSLLQAPIFTSH